MLITWICYSNIGSFFVCMAHWCSTRHLLRTTNKKHCHFSTNDFKWHVVAVWSPVLTIVLITWRHFQVYNGLIKHLQVGIGCLLKRDSEGKWRVKVTMVVTKNKHVNRRGLRPCLRQSLKLFLLIFFPWKTPEPKAIFVLQHQALHCYSSYLTVFSIQRRESDISLIFKSAQPDIYGESSWN